MRAKHVYSSKAFDLELLFVPLKAAKLPRKLSELPTDVIKAFSFGRKKTICPRVRQVWAKNKRLAFWPARRGNHAAKRIAVAYADAEPRARSADSFLI